MPTNLGVLLPGRAFRRLVYGEGEDLRALALEQEETFGVRRLFFDSRALDHRSGRAEALVAAGDGWRETAVGDLPRIYHNQLVRPTAAERAMLRELNGDPRLLVFNEANRWDRGLLTEVLRAVPAARELLGTRFGLTDRAARQAEPGLYVALPARRAAREAAVFVELAPDGRATYTSPRRGVRGEAHGSSLRAALPETLRWLVALGKPPVGIAEGDAAPAWSVQGGAPPEVPQDGTAPRPVEWRFYVLRQEDGTWGLSGALAKLDVFRPRGRVERAWDLQRALELAFGRREARRGRLRRRFEEAALAVARGLAQFMPGLGQLAVDFWADAQGRLVLADLSGFYRLDWLLRAGDEVGLRRAREHPARLARALERRGVERLDVDFGQTRNQGR